MPTHLDRITFDPAVMGGKPCIRGMRVTAGMVVGLVASGHSRKEILALYPYLEDEDITQALRYAAWRSEVINIINNHLGGNEGEAFLHPSYNNILRCAPEQEENLRNILDEYKKIKIHAIPTNNYTDSDLLLEAGLDQNGRKSKNNARFSVNTYKLYLISMLAAWEGFLVCHRASNDTRLFNHLLELADSLGRQDNQDLDEDGDDTFNYYDSLEMVNNNAIQQTLSQEDFLCHLHKALN